VDDRRSASVLRRRHLADEARRSLFVLPALFVVGGAVLGEILAEVDDRIDPGSLPGFLETTDDSARAILGAIAGGTITTAAVVLSFTLVAVQLASSQYSPRTLGRFLGDRFQQLVMGVVFGTFTYSIVVLREIERVGGGVDRPAPQLATTGAVLAGVAAMLAVLASIDHTARSLQVESIAERVSESALRIARNLYPPISGDSGIHEPPPACPPDALAIPAPRTGWVQQLALDGVAEALPPGSTAVFSVAVGDHVAQGEPLVHIWPAPADPGQLVRHVDHLVDLGSTRTMQDDVMFGVIQLVDIAARALSPAINDPYTAQEIILRESPLLVELLGRDLTPHPIRHGDRTVHPCRSWDVDDLLDLAIGSLRWHAREQPRVLVTLLQVLGRLRAGAPDPRPVDAQAEILLSELHRLAPADADTVRRAASDAGWPEAADT
jgi:uncharacterized membrane protein